MDESHAVSIAALRIFREAESGPGEGRGGFKCQKFNLRAILGKYPLPRGKMAGQTHQEMLQKYAEAIVKVGLNLRAGQRLIITLMATRGVPHQFAPLVHEVTKAAYKAGAKYVEVLWGDEEMLRIRLGVLKREHRVGTSATPRTNMELAGVAWFRSTTASLTSSTQSTKKPSSASSNRVVPVFMRDLSPAHS